jgi:ribosomal protein S18 acetylase RimI-like enzyme
MDEVQVRPCSLEDMARLQRSGECALRMAHHRERWSMQQANEALYLLAWRGDKVVGRVTLLYESKYAEVRATFPCLWEMNALEAMPQGRGVGTRLITAAEAEAASGEATAIGLAFEPGNRGAQRLYERLGYSDWGHGMVLDEWSERAVNGRVLDEHRTPCRYAVKFLGRPHAQ